jgi:hypothetical protein
VDGPFFIHGLPADQQFVWAFTTQETNVTMETKFNKDDIVYERVNPSRKLVVVKFNDGIYYCRLPENHKRQFVFQERELAAPAVDKGA